MLILKPKHSEDDVILVWSDVKRIITGANILGRLLRGIVKMKRLKNKLGSIYVCEKALDSVAIFLESINY